MSAHPLPRSAGRNITAVRDLGAELRRDRSPLDRVTGAVSRFVGTSRFLIVQVAVIGGWVAVNCVPGLFDPDPFAFLTFVLAVEALLLTNVVLMAQNRQGREADEQAELHLQIGLLVGQEATKMLQAIHERLGIAGASADSELQDMIRHTHVEVIAEELRRTRDEARRRGNRDGDPACHPALPAPSRSGRETRIRASPPVGRRPEPTSPRVAGRLGPRPRSSPSARTVIMTTRVPGIADGTTPPGEEP